MIPSAMIPTQLDNQTVSEVASTLEQSGKFQSIKLMDLHSTKPVRFSIVDDDVFETLKEQSTGLMDSHKQCFEAGGNEYVLRYDNRLNNQIEGEHCLLLGDHHCTNFLIFFFS